MIFNVINMIARMLTANLYKMKFWISAKHFKKKKWKQFKWNEFCLVDWNTSAHCWSSLKFCARHLNFAVIDKNMQKNVGVWCVSSFVRFNVITEHVTWMWLCACWQMMEMKKFKPTFAFNFPFCHQQQQVFISSNKEQL